MSQRVVTILLITILLVTTDQHAQTIRRSDVVFMYDNPKMYRPYGATVLGWAGWPKQQHIREAHANGVRQFSCSVGLLTESRRVIDFSEDFLDAACRDFDGKPFVTPWLWDQKHKYNGHPSYWWCTNSPLYQRYVFSRIEEVMKSEPDGLHIDDYRGTSGSVTWLAGGFCRHCMSAFRDYLATNVSKDELKAAGVTDLNRFDYRQFLIDRGVTKDDYRKRRNKLPLADAFYDFQVKAANRFAIECRKRAEAVRGKPVSFSVNSGLSSPHALVIARELSHFCCEVKHQAATLKPPTHPVYIYKLADGLNRHVASTASGHDWALVKEQSRPGLVRTWIAMSYAFGHTLMAPHRQWCYTKEKGTHWHESDPADYAPLYRFVRRHARLLDDYEAVAQVAVVYSAADQRRYRGSIEKICATLAERNIPFTVVIAGDDWVDYRLNSKQLSAFKAVIVPKDVHLGDAQQKLIDKVAKQKRLVVWPDDNRLSELVGKPIAVEGSQHIWAVARLKRSDDALPVVHLLNRQYNSQNDSMTPQTNVVIRLRRDLFGGRQVAVATLHTPQSSDRLNVSADEHYVTIKAPMRRHWGLIEFGETN